MNNSYMEQYIRSTIAYLNTFEASLRLAAMKVGGEIDAEEQRVLDKANKLTEKYVRGLKKMIDE